MAMFVAIWGKAVCMHRLDADRLYPAEHLMHFPEAIVMQFEFMHIP